MPIRLANSDDYPAIWHIFREVVARGDSYAFDPDIAEEEALAYWCHAAHRCYVACDEQEVLGTYILKDNQPGLGSHIANASFMVAASARGKGVGRTMGEHAIAEATRLGYRGMQFNYVVSTNHAAIALWKSLGFEIIGSTLGGFCHAELGYVDSHIMYRELIPVSKKET